jgi:hypothetical protein
VTNFYGDSLIENIHHAQTHSYIIIVVIIIIFPEFIMPTGGGGGGLPQHPASLADLRAAAHSAARNPAILPIDCMVSHVNGYGYSPPPMT